MLLVFERGHDPSHILFRRFNRNIMIFDDFRYTYFAVPFNPLLFDFRYFRSWIDESSKLLY